MDEPVISATTTIDPTVVIYGVVIVVLLLIVIILGIYIFVNPRRQMNMNNGDYLL